MSQTLRSNFGRFPVTLVTVEQVDNQGDDCQYCQLEGQQVNAQFYYREDNDPEMMECCLNCLPDVLIYFAGEVQHITVEVARVPTPEQRAGSKRAA